MKINACRLLTTFAYCNVIIIIVLGYAHEQIRKHMKNNEANFSTISTDMSYMSWLWVAQMPRFPGLATFVLTERQITLPLAHAHAHMPNPSYISVVKSRAQTPRSTPQLDHRLYRYTWIMTLLRARERAKYAAILLFIDLRDVAVDVHLLLPSQVISGGMGLQKIPQR